MTKHFHFIMSVIFWLLMVIGFSDNLFFDVGQESNRDPKFIVHGIFSFAWFTLLVVQTGLIRAGNRKLHMKLGVLTLFSYAGFLVSTVFLYSYTFLYVRAPGPLTVLNLAMFAYSTMLIVTGYLARKKNIELHKLNTTVGALMLMEPAIGRAMGHLFGKLAQPMWLLTFLILFGLCVWRYRGFKWQFGIGFLIWLAGTINFIVNM